ncbi:MAG TPA: acyl-CoA dehydrogenase family protein [Ramlibacter sp.]|uniref:acyl-CoA dehydrogenase family protein n=1 Tax=Ramlibacter sp. TaxID=1917967 RepID=UPI002C286D3B|nr:acyl-CoA dehydrogenase family protein [Ramlibacter sp.]HVZ42643.1 acyl-CoA dehydrogenase family protein [Ramlibacter sp.]
MNSSPRFDPVVLPPEARALRSEVRAFLRDELPPRTRFTQSDPDFSRKVGSRGWIGMTWPRQWGGAERGSLERYVVVEELLAANAPIFHHWIADRQSGPLILRYGTDAQRDRLLPRIARGQCCFAIGLSEPGAGSDLASVRTRATRDDAGDWRISGAKIWTSNAHCADFMIVLCRTSPVSGNPREGLGQFIVDMRSSGIAVNPIRNMAGEHEFNEVVFDDVAVPDAMRLGQPGAGWEQLASELALERSGPDRFLSALELLLAFIRAAGPRPTAEEASLIGRFHAHLATLRRMSISVAGALATRSPAVEAAIVKDLGTRMEQEIVAQCRALRHGGMQADDEPDSYEAVLARAMLFMPRVTIQGGTPQILRNAIARGLGLR